MSPRTPDHLFKRGDVWWIRYSIDGQNIRRSLKTRSRDEAIDMRDEIIQQRKQARLGLAPKPVKRSTPTVKQLFTKLEKRQDRRWRAGDLAETTLKALKSRKKPIEAKFGSTLVKDLTAEQIDDWLDELNGQPMSATTRFILFKTLRLALNYAVTKKYITVNPCAQLDVKPRPGPGRDRVATEDELRLLRSGVAMLPKARVRARVWAKLALIMGTGLRWGEVHGLLWKHLDLDIGEVVIEEQWNGRKLKTKDSAATLPLPPDLVTELLAWRQRELDRGMSREFLGLPVFPNNRGERCKSNTVDEVNTVRACQLIGIPKLTPHSLRHTYVTNVFAGSVDLAKACRLARHSKMSMTIRYIHDRSDLRAAVESCNLIPTGPALRVV